MLGMRPRSLPQEGIRAIVLDNPQTGRAPGVGAESVSCLEAAQGRRESASNPGDGPRARPRVWGLFQPEAQPGSSSALLCLTRPSSLVLACCPLSSSLPFLSFVPTLKNQSEIRIVLSLTYSLIYFPKPCSQVSSNPTSLNDKGVQFLQSRQRALMGLRSSWPCAHVPGDGHRHLPPPLTLSHTHSGFRFPLQDPGSEVSRQAQVNSIV